MTSDAAQSLAVALQHHQAGNLALAERLYRELLAVHPRSADAWHLLGALCLQSNRAAEAVELIGRAVELDPTKADYYNHLGAAYGSLDRHEEAVANLRRALEIAPHTPGGFYNLGTALRNQGRLEEAVTCFRRAIAADPNSAEAHYNLGNTLRELKRFDEAETSYRHALAARPNYLKAMINLGNVLRDQKRFDDAIEILQAAIALNPNYANAHLNLGTALRDTGRLRDALASMERAATLDPNSPEIQNNLGTVLQALARFDEASACYQRAIDRDPDFPDAHFGRALDWLRQGELARGFVEYEWRWKCKTFSARPFSQPRWDGSELAGETILLYAEQGLGDTLHFVRFATDAKRRGGRVIVECQPALLKILASMPEIDQLIALGSPLPDFDVHAPLMSLPGILQLRPSLDDLWHGPYLSADPQLVEKWRTMLAKYPGFRIGVCWQGNPEYLFDKQRSFPLAQLSGVANVPGVRLISLQKQNGLDQIESAGFEVINLGPQLDEAAAPFMDTAAVMKNLDLVITSDTSVAHLAGALGVNVWLPLSAHCDWRWMKDRTDTPWYPTMRLFRQQELDRWDEVFEAMKEELHR